MSKTLNEELDEMAKVELAKDNTVKSKKSYLAFILVVVAIVVYKYIDNELDQELAKYKKEKIEMAEYNYKHWANVLMVIHSKDSERAVNIMTETDRPHRSINANLLGDKYINTCYLVTRELEEILRNKGIRYQRRQYNNEDELKSLWGPSASLVTVMEISTTKPWINW